VELLGTLKN
jgi:hypothetical protein